MLNFLKAYSLTDEQIQKIINSYDENLIKNLDYKKNNTMEVLNFFKDFGVNDIYNLLMTRLDLVFLSVNHIKQNFSKLDKSMLLYILNNSIDDLINFNI